jgi:hypothetical protein
VELIRMREPGSLTEKLLKETLKSQ